MPKISGSTTQPELTPIPDLQSGRPAPHSESVSKYWISSAGAMDNQYLEIGLGSNLSYRALSLRARLHDGLRGTLKSIRLHMSGTVSW